MSITMNTLHRKNLPGTGLDYFDTRAAVDAIQAGAYATLPYTSRVLAENLVRRCDPETLNASLRQFIERRRDLDRSGAHAAVLLGEGETQQAHLGQLRPDLLVEARVGLGDLAAGLAVAVGAGQQRGDGLAQVVLLAVVGEVHGYLTTPGSCR